MLRKLLILSCLCFAVVAFAQKNKKKKNTAHEPAANAQNIDYKAIGAPLPPIRLIVPADLTKAARATTPDSAGHTKPYEYKALTEKDFAAKGNLLIMTFNPTCEHCQDETEILKKNVHLFKNTKIILMASPSMVQYLEFFNNGTLVTEYPSTMTMGVDSNQYVEKTFLYQTLPQLNFYDHDRKLIRAFTGEVPIDSLKRYID
jgi:hypothetical protein